MFNKVSWFLSTFSFYIISAIIVALILINMFIPNGNSSKEEMYKDAGRVLDELTAICISEGYTRGEALEDCVKDKWPFGD
jgi:uncharacterized membrane protein